jgi:redox-sensitive bicupin YhaK (pirin superfamily)
VLEGEVTVGGEPLAAGSLLYFGTGCDRLGVEAASPARLLLIGGAPFGEDVLLWWNFVARTYGEMEQATRDWQESDRFGEVLGARGARLVAPELKGLRLREKR